MSDPYVGQIILVSFDYAPRGWAFCNGQILPITQNQPLFALLNKTFGGDGVTTFALPDLRGRAPVHISGTLQLGAMVGQEQHALTVAEIPFHAHEALCSDAPANTDQPQGASWAPAPYEEYPLYYGGLPDALMSPQALTSTGGNQPHENMQPYLVMNYLIALQGIFPSKD